MRGDGEKVGSGGPQSPRLWDKRFFLSEQRSCGPQRVEETLIAFFLALSSHCLAQHSAVVGHAQQSRVAKAPGLWPEYWKASPRNLEGPERSPRGRSSGEQPQKVAYELLGSFPSCTCMDLTLTSVGSLLEPLPQMATRWRPQTSWRALQSQKTDLTWESQPRRAGWNVRSKPNQIDHLLC